MDDDFAERDAKEEAAQEKLAWAIGACAEEEREKELQHKRRSQQQMTSSSSSPSRSSPLRASSSVVSKKSHHASCAKKGSAKQVLRSILKKREEHDDTVPAASSLTPAVNVPELALRTMRDRKAALAVVDVFLTAEKFDSVEALLDVVKPALLTRTGYKDACEERSLGTGTCGWMLCSNRLSEANDYAFKRFTSKRAQNVGS